MATNFEVYKTKLLYSISENDFCIKRDGAIGICSETPCNECVLYEYGPCNVEAALKWANAEHIEAPKLTKRERAFCEAAQTGWIARGCNMHLFYFSGKPELKQGTWMTHVGQHCRIKGIEDAFVFIKDTDAECWAVEDLLKLDVVEEVQDDA